MKRFSSQDKLVMITCRILRLTCTALNRLAAGIIKQVRFQKVEALFDFAELALKHLKPMLGKDKQKMAGTVCFFFSTTAHAFDLDKSALVPQSCVWNGFICVDFDFSR